MVSDKNKRISSLSSEQIDEFTKFANAVTWKKPSLDVLRPEFIGQYPVLTELIQDVIKKADARKKLLLPDLRAFENQTVAVFTDYSGEDKKAKYHTYSFLVCGWNLLDIFKERMAEIRAEYHLGEKEISFKDFRLGPIQRALPNYLNALDLVPGFLFSVAIDKQLPSLFAADDREGRAYIQQLMISEGFGERKFHVTEKLLRITHIAAYLTGLLTHDTQKVFWMSDHDSISATSDLHDKSLALFQNLLRGYSRKGYAFPVFGGALPFEPRVTDMLDLLSAADIVSGALAKYLTERDRVSQEKIRVKAGCDKVLQWLAHDGLGLKKMCVLLRPGEDRTVYCGTLNLTLEERPNGVVVIPVRIDRNS